jgi:L,D-transpeptidase YcbB
MTSVGLWLSCLVGGVSAVAAPTVEWGVNQAQDTTVSDLENALRRYETMVGNGGWPKVSDGPRLEPGARDARIPVLRARLAAEGYSPGSPSDEPDLYDPTLETAVRRFQALHGLAEDGIVGPGTLQALNVSAPARARQIAGNIARRRSQPDSLGDRYIVVNTAAFTLEVVEAGQSILRLPVIVGRPTWRTPVVSTQIAELIFRPLWRVPRSIAVAEVLPLVRRNPGYLDRNNMRIFRDSANGSEVDPADINWPGTTAKSFRYQFVQEPGPANPLGGVKFVLQTPYGVHLHDTSAPGLFARPVRALSHGCVRVDRAEELAAYLLPGWPADSIGAAMVTGRERRVRLPVPMPVHLVYWTAWTEGDGPVAFRTDVFRWDR